MQLTALLSKVTDFLNLGKFLVDAGPGILLALALTLFATSWAHLPVVPVEVRDGGFVSRYARFLDSIDQQIRCEEKALRDAVKAKAEAETAAARGQKKLDAADTTFRELAKVRQDRLTQGVLDTGRVGQAESEADPRPELEVKVSQLAGELAVASRRVTTHEKQLETLRERQKGLESQRLTRLEDLFTLLLNHLVGLTLVGWILGLIMNPINRMLILPGQGKGDAPGSLAVREAEPPTVDQQVELLLERYNTSYFIGRGIISKSDWDSMVSGYYRWAELSANLVFPALALGAAIAFTMLNSQVAGPSPAAPLLAMAAAVVAAAVAFLTGWRNYRVYKEKMKDFTRGSLKAYLDRIQAQISGQAKTLDEVVTAAEAFLQKLEKKGA